MSSLLLGLYFENSYRTVDRVKFTLSITDTVHSTVQYTTTPFQCCGCGSTWNRIIMGSQIRVKGRIRIKVKFMSCGGSKWSHGGPWTLKMEAWRL